VINLLSNAVKFTQPNGRVEVTARRSGRFVEIAVRDNGIGISPEHLEKLGTPFYQADSKYDRQYEGTGLGLSLVFGLVQLHGGTVEIDSERNSGTTITVRLPIDAAAQQPVPAVEELHFVNPAVRLGGAPAKSSAGGM
jgi:cell cycle sensor histidine kinase DivJ